jgi:hypothetical protein
MNFLKKTVHFAHHTARALLSRLILLFQTINHRILNVTKAIPDITEDLIEILDYLLRKLYYKIMFLTARKKPDVTKIYLQYDFYAINFLMSIYDPNEKNLFVVSDRIAESTLLRDLFPNDPVISFPHQMFPHPYPPKEEWGDQFSMVKKVRHHLMSSLKHVGPNAEVILFIDFTFIYFFVVVDFLREQGLKAKFVNSHQFYVTKHSDQELLAQRPPDFQRYLKKLSYAAGVKLVEFAHEPVGVNVPPGGPEPITAIGFGLAEPLESAAIAPLSWPDIMEKFGLNESQQIDGAILFIETMFNDNSLWGVVVDVEKTTESVTKFFSSKLQDGLEIHVKPHYSDPEYNMFEGTSLEHHVKLLPGDIPAELIMNKYEEVYMFLSSCARRRIRGKKYSLSPLVVFKDKTEERRYCAIQAGTYGSERNQAGTYTPDIENVKPV